MRRRKYLYIVKPRELVERDDLPDHVYRRYDRLLAAAWEETGSQYLYVRHTNEELGLLWRVNERTVQETLAAMREWHLIKTEQDGQYGRIIRLLVAYRAQRMDSPEEINAASERTTHLEAQAAAAKEQSQPKSLGCTDTAPQTDLPNSVVVAVDCTRDLYKTATTTLINTRVREILRSICDSQGRRLEEPALSELAMALREYTASAWAEWIPRAPATFSNPVAYMVRRLSVDSMALPPTMKRRRHPWPDAIDQYVNR